MPKPANWSPEFLDQMRQTADPLADQAVAQLVATEGREAAQQLFDLLIRRIEMPLEELPVSLKDYWEATQHMPDWVDPQKIETAHALFQDHGPKFLLFLYYKSLPLLYCCKNGAQVLVQTSRLAHNQEDITIFTRRIAETGQFLIDVMTDGGLQPGKTGIQSIQKVRLIHAAIRHFIPPERWDTQRLGMPINQEDLAVTLMTFSIAVADGLEQFGIPEPTERLEAYLHCWKGVGALLGIDERLLPADLASARTLLETILKRQAAPSEAGQLLTKALVEFAERTLPAERMDDAPRSLIHYLIGRERAQMLGITPAAGCLPAAAPFFLKSLFRAGERLEDKIREPKSVFIDWFSTQMARRMVGYFDTYKQRHFEVPERMRQAWFEEGG